MNYVDNTVSMLMVEDISEIERTSRRGSEESTHFDQAMKELASSCILVRAEQVRFKMQMHVWEGFREGKSTERNEVPIPDSRLIRYGYGHGTAELLVVKMCAALWSGPSSNGRQNSCLVAELALNREA